MSKEPIIIVGGEPNSVFLEIFFKSIKANNYKSPLIIIVSKKLLKKQMEKLGFTFKINDIDKKFKNISKLNNKKINLINVDYSFQNCFEKITSKSNDYINNTFAIALKIIHQNNFSKFINGPVSKKYFLKGKTLGITEYLAKKAKKSNKVAMLIFNKDLSVSPLTTHLALKNVHKIGIRSGATRASTGYTFLNIQKQSEFFAKEIKGIHSKNPLLTSKAKILRKMDGILLRIIKNEPKQAKNIIFKMFTSNNHQTIIRFLSDIPSIFDILRIIINMPKLIFIKYAIKSLINRKI